MVKLIKFWGMFYNNLFISDSSETFNNFICKDLKSKNVKALKDIKSKNIYIL